MDTLQFGRVRFIPGDNGGRYPYCHSLFLEADRRVIIDPSSNEAALSDLRHRPGIDEVWLSHYHEDHFLYLGLFDDKKLAMSEQDAGALASMDDFLDYYGITDPGDRAAWGEIMGTYFCFHPRKAEILFADGDIVDLGGLTVEVLSTPGHTLGHLSFFVREQELLFIGDYDFQFPYYGDRDSDIEQTISSINRLRKVPASVWIVPHDRGIYREDPNGLWDRFLAVIERREERLLDLLREPRTMTDIIEARIVYGKVREPKIFYDFGEMSIMKKHLGRLVEKGAISCEGARYRIVR